MSEYVWGSLIAAGIFFLMALLFAVLKEKALRMLNGYGTVLKGKVNSFDVDRMVHDKVVQFSFGGLAFVVSAILYAITNSTGYMIMLVVIIAILVYYYASTRSMTKGRFAKYYKE